jgi:hypothetical protein
LNSLPIAIIGAIFAKSLSAVDDDRRFAAELERHRRQILRGSLRDHATHRCRPGEKQMIEWELDEPPARSRRRRERQSPRRR